VRSLGQTGLLVRASGVLLPALAVGSCTNSTIISKYHSSIYRLCIPAATLKIFLSIHLGFPKVPTMTTFVVGIEIVAQTRLRDIETFDDDMTSQT
jgi:hypothetical protein